MKKYNLYHTLTVLLVSTSEIRKFSWLKIQSKSIKFNLSSLPSLCLASFPWVD